MKQQDEAIKQTFIAMHIQGTLARQTQLSDMGIISAPEQPETQPPAPKTIVLRSTQRVERRIEKYVTLYRQRTGQWPQINRIVCATHICAGDLVGTVLNSNVLDYTVPAGANESDMDQVMQWSIELKEATPNQ